jgi:hypothetical protein
MKQAQAELSALGAQAASAFPLTHARLQPRVMPYAHPILDIQGITTRDFTAMQSLISMLALIVAVNVGVLVYDRTATRQREIAVEQPWLSRRRIVGRSSPKHCAQRGPSPLRLARQIRHRTGLRHLCRDEWRCPFPQPDMPLAGTVRRVLTGLRP